jgi:hypothetical protein
MAGSQGVSANWENIALVNRILAEIQDDLKPTARKELRKGTQQIARDLVIPILDRHAAASGVPIGPAMADTASAYADRIVFVKVGAKNPRLTNFRRGKDTKYRTGMAWGSELGGSHYGVGRNSTGYWVQPAVRSPGTLSTVKDAYAALLNTIIAKYSRYR